MKEQAMATEIKAVDTYQRFIFLIALFTVLFTSCEFGPEVWEPHVLQVRYTKNDETEILDLTQSGPILVIDAGDALEFKEFTLSLLPTRRTESGTTMYKFKDLPPVPDSALALYARVLARMRKLNGTDRCYDKRDQVATDWFRTQPQSWTVQPYVNLWKLEQNWDEIRIDIELRSFSPYRSRATTREFLQNVIMLQPTAIGNQLQRNIGQNIFSRILEDKEQFCSE